MERIEYYLISNGTLNNVTKCMLVEVDSLFATPEEAADIFAAETGTPREEVVINPVGPRCG